jgi:DNA-binding beta-propeller fold protein YncE
VVFSPDGKQVAVGYADSNRVDVLSGHDLSLLLTPDLRGINGTMAHVAWSAEGNTLFSGEEAKDGQGQRFIRTWSNGGRGAYRDTPAGVRTIMGLLALPRGDLVFTAADPRWGVLRGAGRIDLLHTAEVADYPSEITSGCHQMARKCSSPLINLVNSLLHSCSRIGA